MLRPIAIRTARSRPPGKISFRESPRWRFLAVNPANPRHGDFLRPAPAGPRFNRSALDLLLFLLLAPAAFAAAVPPGAKSFDIPAGSAAQTLKQFAAQAAREIVFALPEVAAIQTNAVRGVLPPAEALARMLEGTGLAARHDAKTGAFAVRKKPVPKTSHSPPRPDSRPRAPPAAEPMKASPFATLLATLATTFHLHAAQPNPANPDPDVVQLSPFTVDSSKDVGYKASNSISGTRTNVPIAEVPMNIAVVTSELLNDLAVQTPTEALRYFGSVQNNRQGDSNDAGVDLDATGALFGDVRLRGLTSGTNLRNGIRVFSQLPSEFVDRVELVRGPAAVLYGLSDPTGIYNVITKAPVFNRTFGRAQARYGSYNNYGGSLDVNYNVRRGLAVRLNAMAAHHDTEFWFNEGDSHALLPQVSWRPFEKTLVQVEYLYSWAKRARPDQRHAYAQTNTSVQTTPNYPVLVPGMDIPLYEDSRYQVDPRYNFAGPDAYREVRERSYVITLSQQIGEHLNVNLQGNYYERPHINNYSNIALIQGNGTFWLDQPTPPQQDAFQLRRWDLTKRWDWVKTFVGTAVYKRDVDLGPLGRTNQAFTVGFQGFYNDSNFRQWADQRDLRRRDAQGRVLIAPFIPGNVPSTGNAALLRENYPSLNGGIFDARNTRPSPGIWFDYLPINMDVARTRRTSDVVMTLLPPGTGTFTSLANSNRTKNDFTSAWVQWSGKFWKDRVILSAGVFKTDIQQETGNSEATLRPFYDKSATLPQYGVVLRPFRSEWGNVSFFALYSESLQPNSDLRDAFNNPFEPRLGKGHEFGVKLDVWQGRVSGTISTWDIEQTNRVIFDANAPNPNNPTGIGANVARGLNTSQGWEADIILSWNTRWQTMLSYAWMDVFSGNDPNPLLNGSAEIGSYERGFGAVTSYRFGAGRLNGLIIGLGANYKSEEIAEAKRAGFNGERQRVYPSIWDGNAFVAYRHKVLGYNTRFQLNVTNLFEIDRPVGWNPTKVNDLGVANAPFLYETERKVTLTTTVEF
jgi:iron complex outermembrane receptor protein